MSQETLDLRRSVRIVRRHKLLMGVAVALGILACGAYAVLKPSMVTSTALVLLSPTGQAAQSAAAAAGNGGPDPYTQTQEVIAKSTPVLLGALPDVRPPHVDHELRDDVTIGSQTAFIISISVQARDAGRRGGKCQRCRQELYRLYRLPRQPRAARFSPSCSSQASRGTGSGLIKQAIMILFLLCWARYSAR